MFHLWSLVRFPRSRGDEPTKSTYHPTAARFSPLTRG